MVFQGGSQGEEVHQAEGKGSVVGVTRDYQQ